MNNRKNNNNKRSVIIIAVTFLIAGIIFFMFGQMWQKLKTKNTSFVKPQTFSHPRPARLPRPPPVVVTNETPLQFTIQGPTYNPYGRYPPLPVPMSYDIGREELIGYLVPANTASSATPLNDYSHLPLYKVRMDHRGYRFEYYTKNNGVPLYLMSKKDGTKTCNSRSGIDGCKELYHEELVKINLNDADYVVKLYSR